MRILIADDEALVRYSLVSILEDLLDEAPSIVEATNGQELAARARDFQPNVAFVDIRMPKMDGLSAIEKARKSTPETVWVILTGHADFSYARKALRLEVEDFLLKPPDPGEIRNVMETVTQRMAQRRNTANRILASKVAAVLDDTTSIRYDAYFSENRYWQAAVLCWDSFLSETDLARRRRETAIRLRSMLEEVDWCSGCLASPGKNPLLLVLSTPSTGLCIDKLVETWRGLLATLKERSADALGDDVGDTWFLTRVVLDPRELFDEIRRIDRGSGIRFLDRPGRMIEFTDSLGRRPSASVLDLADRLEQAVQAWRLGKEDEFHGLVHKISTHLDEIPESWNRPEGLSWYARQALPLSGPPPTNLPALLSSLHDQSHGLFADQESPWRATDSEGSLVDRAAAIMSRRYREAIGIAQVAEELGVTPNYLSTLFKRSTGQGFTSRLTQLRLEKSKELLTGSGASVRDVALSLGYQSGRHFSRLFKDRFGMTPSEWIAQGRP